MRLGTIRDEPVALRDEGAASLAAASAGRYATMGDVLGDWAAFRAWARTAPLAYRPYDPRDLGPPVPHPGQVFGVGLNYRSHLAEAGRATTRERVLPLAFTKFPASLTGPFDDVLLHSEHVDWEVELVAVLGAVADRVRVADAPHAVAGYMVGQDLSDRAVQRAGQLSLGKSFRTYAPCGPYLVTADAVPDPQRLALRCAIGDEVVQDASTADMLYTVAELVALLSAVVPLRPGDLLFTGTAAGVGVFRDPPRFLRPGDVVHSEVEGLGAMRNVCRAAPANPEPLARRWRVPLAPAGPGAQAGR